MAGSTTVRKALRTFKGDTAILKKCLSVLRKLDSGNRKLLKNLLKDYHSQVKVFHELFKFAQEPLVRSFINDKKYDEIKLKFDQFCSLNRFSGTKIKIADWGPKCYRVVRLQSFANSLRKKIAEYAVTLESKLGQLGKQFVRRTKIAPAITTDEQAIRFIKELKMSTNKDERREILAVINLSVTGIVWTSPEEEIEKAFVSQSLDLVKDVILRLGMKYLQTRSLLLKYEATDLVSRDIPLCIPTPFDAGWYQGYFVPCDCHSRTGQTASLHSTLGGFPEGIHDNIDCGIVDPKLEVC